MKKRIIVALIIVLSAFIAFYRLALKNESPDLSVRTSGIVEGTEVNLSSKIPGRISEICCSEGDRVSKGQAVIKLESNDLNAAVEQAEAGVDRARSGIRVAEASVQSARAELKSAEADIQSFEAEMNKAMILKDEAERELKRDSSLYRQELLSKESYERSMTSFDTASAEYASVKARLAASHTKKTAAKAKLDAALGQKDAAESLLNESIANLSYRISKFEDTEIISLMDGTVMFNAFEKGETVTPGVTIMTIVDLEHLYVRADIEETLIVFITLGTEAVTRAEGLPGREFRGRISEIGREADFATQRDVVRGRQDIKTFRVRIQLDNTDGILKPGMTVDVEIPKKQAEK